VKGLVELLVVVIVVEEDTVVVVLTVGVETVLAEQAVIPVKINNNMTTPKILTVINTIIDYLRVRRI
jgi:hypothetical protein